QPPQPATHGSSSDPRAYLTAANNPGGSGPQPPSHPQQQQQPLSHPKSWASYNGGGQVTLSTPQRQPLPQSQSQSQSQQQPQQQQATSLRPRQGPAHQGGPLGGPSPAQPPQQQNLENGGISAYGGSDGRRTSPEPHPSTIFRGWQGLAPGAPQNGGGISGSNGLGISSGPGANAGPSRTQHPFSQKQHPPPPPPLASANSHPQANAYPHPHPPHMRLPPIDLAAPRRHSLAVTSHLERYRARNATPPPDSGAAPAPAPAQQKQTMQAEACAESAASAASAAAPRHAMHYQHSHAPLSTIYQSPPASNGAIYSGRPVQPPPQQMSPLPEGRALPPMGPGSGSAGEARPVRKPSPLPASFINYTPSVRQAPALQTPPKSGVSELQQSAPAINLVPPSAGVDHSKGNDAGASRRGSAYSGAELVPETRRSSIIALTNPPSESDIRIENVELKRRLDEMESKYQKEVERLNTIVRELEIEKSLLKSLLIEQRGASSAGAASSSAADAEGMGDMMSVSPPPVARTSVSSGGQVTAVASEDMPLAHTIRMSSAGAGLGTSSGAGSGSGTGGPVLGSGRNGHSLGTMSSPQSAPDMHFRFGRQQQPYHRQHLPTSSASTPGPNPSRQGNI
ncbi:hypothetical protein LPJ75_004296, partial [Coemansia sp. RSA 2598]